PYPYIWLSPDRELTQLRAMARSRVLPADLAATLVHLELEVGTLDSATASLARAGTSLTPATRDHLAAEIAFARGDAAAGTAAYDRGAGEIADSGAARLYGWDVFWIAEADERNQWQALPLDGTARKAWLDRFWTKRDLNDGRPSGTRLVEQFRRWRLALQQYRWDPDGGLAVDINDKGYAEEMVDHLGGGMRQTVIQPGDPGTLTLGRVNYVNRWRALGRVIDDRGAMILRHGDPVFLPMAASIETTTEQNLAWQTPAGRLIVGFSRIAVGSERFGMVARNIPMGDPMVSCQYDARLCGARMKPFVIEDYSHQRETLEHTDGNAETYHDSLGAIVQTYGIPHGGTLIVVAVPARGLVRDSTTRAAQRQFAARLQIEIGDSAAGKIVATVDTTRRWTTTHALPSDAWLSTYLTVPVNPGNWEVVVTVSDTAHTTGTGARFGAVPVSAFDGSTLALSDPIVGRHDAGLTWTHDGTAIPLNPTNAWHRDQSVTVHYDIDGQVPGRRYDTQFELWSTRGHPKAPAFTIAFSAQASTARSTVERELSPAHLTPGEYRLILRVRDSVTGKDVTRERYVAILK
ncbi:MAG TPA: hypothetical protein VHW65_01405, partial [Gemmatimonadales bacterium]|nr:hypothetical protein [Gemmatimonadales bacterium]